MKLTLCRSIMIMIMLACILAVTCAIAFERGIVSCQDNKVKCVTKDHNTMCEEVKK